MKLKEFLRQTKDLIQAYRITNGKGFKLRDFSPDDTANFKSDKKEEATELLTAGLKLITELQDKLYAQDRWGVLLIFQAMDAAGKDSVIKHVMSASNPQGSEVSSFKVPTAEELDHDFMWRCLKRLPERGRFSIFNRSYYEETIVVRVHEEYLKAQKIPPQLITNDIWKQRFEDIRSLERYVSRNGMAVRKFFLNVSKEEQKARFLERIERPEKNWKFSMVDVRERGRWKEYAKAYEETIQHTASSFAPWFVVPADHKWFTRLVVAAAVVECLASLDLNYPTLSKEELNELNAAAEVLRQE